MRFKGRAFGLILVFCLAVVVGFTPNSHTQPQPRVIVKGELGKKLDEYMTGVESAGFSGALVVAKGDSVVLSKGYGMANRALKLPFTPDTIVSTGSITKMFTAAAILKLEMEGKLHVSDPITKFLPNVPADKAGITIHHLLTHTAGFGLQFGGDFDKIGRDEFVKRVMTAPLESPPGTKPNYSNAGFSLAAVIVELASGQSYEQYLYDNLFKPAGMTQTGYTIPRWKPEALAHGYQGSEDWGTLPDKAWGPDGPYWILRGNGAVHTTIGDMYRWYRALQGDKLLSEAAKRKFFTPHVQEEEGGDLFFGYGCGILKTTRGTKLVTKNGGNRVFYAELRLYVDDGVMFFIVSTNSEFPGRRVVPKINEILLGSNQPGEG